MGWRRKQRAAKGFTAPVSRPPSTSVCQKQNKRHMKRSLKWTALLVQYPLVMLEQKVIQRQQGVRTVDVWAKKE